MPGPDKPPPGTGARNRGLAILKSMSAPLPTGGAPLEVQTWHELEDVFAELSQLARSPIAPHDFYRTVLDQSVRTLSAEGGAVWLRASGGTFQIAAQTGHP